MTVHPRPHQVTALTALATALAVNDRTQLVMACGTGKTLVGRWHAQASDSQRVLVLLPSLALVAQTLQEWRRATGNVATGWRFRALVVCSDPTTTAGFAERAGEAGEPDDELDVDAKTWDQVEARVTTDAGVAARLLRDCPPGRPQVMFSTYHSSPVVAAAQKQLGEAADFDLVICDEAHRLAGRPSKAFTTVLDTDRIRAGKRLFMTATPKAFTAASGFEDGISMDDVALFGPVAHTVSFGAAIDAGLLCDYQVLVVSEQATTGSESRPADLAHTVPAALVKAIDRYGLRRVLSFHGRVAKAAAFAAEVDGRHTQSAQAVVARHVSGSMRTEERMRTLRWLGAAGPEVRVVSNARCLSEGVDVPAVDGVLFADRRTSVVDIIQAIGRVLRPAPGKTVGTIVLPVTLPVDGDDDTGLALSAFEHVWTVLRGLRAHDQRLAEELDDASRRWARADGSDEPWHWRVKTARGGGFRIPRVEFVFPEGVEGRQLLADMELRTVQAVGSMWEENYGLLQTWAEAHDGKLIPTTAQAEGGVRLGQWVLNQRILHRRDALDPDRARRLEEIPGWAWDPKDARWWQTLDLVKDFAAGTVDGRTGLAHNETGKSRFDDVYTRETPRIWLGVWMARQRQDHRMGTLAPDRVAGLEAIDGWTWDGGLPAGEIEMVEALREFVEFEKHAGVPEGHVDGDLRLGAWCWAVRRRRLTGRLAPALYDEILAATPSKDLTERFQWEFDETRWRLGYFALRQFTDREGAARPRGSHREELPDVDYGLGQWCAQQRLKYRRGELDQRYAELLEALPGWLWEIPLQRVEPQEPVDLPTGSRHGTPGAYQNFGCRCAECLEWRRASDVDRLAEKRKVKDPVPAVAFRRRVEEIEAGLDTEANDDGARNGRMLISAVSAVSIGVIRAVMRGERDQVERDHERRMLATTLEDCLQARNQEGSRGRTTSTLLGLVDSAPTFARLEDLKGRGFGLTWVSRELEYAGGLQLKRHARIRGHLAQRVADLHHRVGDLVMPTLPVTVRKPTLAELQQSATEKAS